MIEITVNADKQIRKLLDKQGLPGGGLRVGVKAGGCSGFSYVFSWAEVARPEDQVLEGPQGARVFVDPKSLKFLDGTVLDFDTSLISRGFVFENPRARSTCGCGSSFSM